MAKNESDTMTEQWDVFEVELQGPDTANPFTDVSLSATFVRDHRLITVDGFYDGSGVYRIRFAPDTIGSWTYQTNANVETLNGHSGSFECVPASKDNHGPVRVVNRSHFAYEDGTSYVPVGTTCYVWNHQGDRLESQTIETLRAAPFNKMRMCVFPKNYDFNLNEPEYYPFAGEPLTSWEFDRFNPAFFQHLERRIADLRDLGIEADLILFHPYDRWGFAKMSPEADERYLTYLVARLSAFRNVWWSFANEYDLMGKTELEWDRLFKIVQQHDPYDHLRSIHNCNRFYDHAKPWVTHSSIQHHTLNRVAEWIETYGKPVVVDECGYEGTIHRDWGNLTAREMVNRFWIGFCLGGYVGHGETYVHPEDILWWSKGGTLHGESPKRIAFLRTIIEEGPAEGLDRVEFNHERVCAGKDGEYYLCYFADRQPAYRVFELPDGEFTIEVIDAWDMTIEQFGEVHTGHVRVDLPGKPLVAVRIRSVG